MTTILISGMTCAGKSHLLKELVKQGLAKVMTTTTRKPRANEINGVDYKFMSFGEFDSIEKKGGFVETNEFSGEKYGTQIADLLNPVDQVIVVDPNGHRRIKKLLKEKRWPYLSVFLDVDEREQAYRFMERARHQLEFARNSGNFIKPVVKANASRMAEMLTTERHWRDVARCKESPYDLVIDNYNEQSQQACIQELLERIRQAA